MAKAAQFDSEAFVGEKPDMAPSTAHLLLGEELNTSMSLNKRSVIMDEDRFEERFLRCQICKELFSHTKLPRIFPCHHSFCQRCVDQVFQNAVDTRHTYIARMPLSAPAGAVFINCSTCKVHFIATEEQIRKLPTDHRVAQLMDFIHNTQRCTVTFCCKHKLQPLNFFCDTCIMPVCRDCTVSDHKETEDHMVSDLGDALAKYTPILETSITEMGDESICLEEKNVALAAVTKHLDKVKIDLLDQIKSCMARMRDLLDERERTLIAKVHQETEKECGKLQETSEQLETRRRELVDKSRRLRQAKDNNLVQEMFNIHQEVRKFRQTPPMRIREVDDGLLTTFILNTRDEAMLTSRINNFGDIASKVETTSSIVKTTKTAKPYIFRSSSFR